MVLAKMNWGYVIIQTYWTLWDLLTRMFPHKHHISWVENLKKKQLFTSFVNFVVNFKSLNYPADYKFSPSNASLDEGTPLLNWVKIHSQKWAPTDRLPPYIPTRPHFHRFPWTIQKFPIRDASKCNIHKSNNTVIIATFRLHALI